MSTTTQGAGTPADLPSTLAAAARTVDGVAALYARPGAIRWASRIADVQPSTPAVAVSSTPDSTRVTVDVAVAAGHSGPDVGRAVAGALLAVLDAAGVPGPHADVRVVALV